MLNAFLETLTHVPTKPRLGRSRRESYECHRNSREQAPCREQGRRLRRGARPAHVCGVLVRRRSWLRARALLHHAGLPLQRERQRQPGAGRDADAVAPKDATLHSTSHRRHARQRPVAEAADERHCAPACGKRRVSGTCLPTLPSPIAVRPGRVADALPHPPRRSGYSSTASACSSSTRRARCRGTRSSTRSCTRGACRAGRSRPSAT